MNCLSEIIENMPVVEIAFLDHDILYDIIITKGDNLGIIYYKRSDPKIQYYSPITSIKYIRY